jgi:hypothetical protein
MSQIADPARIVADAEHAARLATAVQDHPGFKAACARLETHYLSLFRNSDPNEPQARESAFFMLRALDVLKQDIASAAAGGAITSRNLRARVR